MHIRAAEKGEGQGAGSIPVSELHVSGQESLHVSG
jgi:hypothetical protein